MQKQQRKVASGLVSLVIRISSSDLNGLVSDYSYFSFFLAHLQEGDAEVLVVCHCKNSSCKKDYCECYKVSCCISKGKSNPIMMRKLYIYWL